MEFFHGTLKRELIYQKKHITREEAKKSVFEYIKIFHNNKHIHSAVESFSLFKYERMYFNKIS
ncbi:IS3 family transposase [Aneurinibacillus sp. UBA3580]|uniref:IS3 family transposase n=1 Tax=Aneurinibacillus sp. UBA3580 TaxID=1946041 RepID=UPI0039C89DDD